MIPLVPINNASLTNGPLSTAKTGDPDHVEECLRLTAEALLESRAASDLEIQRAMSVVRESHANGVPLDLIEQLARQQGHAEEHVGAAIAEIGNKVSATLFYQVPLIPFASKLIAPSVFYESYSQIHKLCRLLLTPVIFTEDTDAIGVASINPIAASVLTGEIETAVFKRFGIRPFFTIVRLEYESWAFLTRKHFGL